MRRAATIVLLSNRSEARGGSFDVLMVKRHSKARFMANVYVFPGGCVDAEDEVAARSVFPETNALAAFRVAAARELVEETGLIMQRGKESGITFSASPSVASSSRGVGDVDASLLLTPFAHWVTPQQERYRYDTWFFTAEAPLDFALRVPAAQLTPDPREVADIKWVSPQEALDKHHKESDASFRLPPPTYLIMKELATFQTATDVVAAKSKTERDNAFPRVEPVLELDPSLIGGPAVIRRMHMAEGWIPSSVLPTQPDGRPVQKFAFPVFDDHGAMRWYDVRIHQARDMPVGVPFVQG